MGEYPDDQFDTFDNAWNAYLRLLPPQRQESSAYFNITQFPLYVTPQEIRRTFAVRQDHAVIGIGYDQQGGAWAETLPLLRGESVLFAATGPAYENGAPIVSLARSLIHTHESQCEVFGYGDLTRYLPGDEFARHNQFHTLDRTYKSLYVMFDQIREAIREQKTPVVFLELLNRKAYAWGELTVPWVQKTVDEWCLFLDSHARDVVLIGSIGTDHDTYTKKLGAYFDTVLLQADDDPYRSRFGLVYTNGVYRVQSAANAFVRTFQAGRKSIIEYARNSDMPVPYDD